MKEKLKVMTILGTRPEIIRLSETIKKCDKYFNHILVHTGQNYDYELNEIFFNELGLKKPDYYLDCAGKNLGETIGNIISKTYEIIMVEKPDAVVILGDTNSALSAISAKRLKTPIFHLEAGNRCWDFNVAEMTNRMLVDHIADINLPYTDNSRRLLAYEGIDPKTIFVIGSPMYEVLKENLAKIEKSEVLRNLNLTKGEYIVVSAHREENIDIDENFENLVASINTLAETYKVPIIYSCHPRSYKRIQTKKIVFDPLVQIHKPFGFIDYIKLQQCAKCVVSDSGTLTEESAMLHFNAVLFRTSTERPEGLDYGTIIVSGIKKGEIVQAVNLAIDSGNELRDIPLSCEYNVENVSLKVVKIIQSYTHIVNKTTWGKR